MVEALDYLRANGFKPYIVSGGGIEFMRLISEQLYGIPPEQVIGSSGKLKYELRNGVPLIVRLPELDFFDDKEGKYICDWPGRPNRADQMLGSIRELRAFVAVCAEHARHASSSERKCAP